MMVPVAPSSCFHDPRRLIHAPAVSAVHTPSNAATLASSRCADGSAGALDAADGRPTAVTGTEGKRPAPDSVRTQKFQQAKAAYENFSSVLDIIDQRFDARWSQVRRSRANDHEVPVHLRELAPRLPLRESAATNRFNELLRWAIRTPGRAVGSELRSKRAESLLVLATHPPAPPLAHAIALNELWQSAFRLADEAEREAVLQGVVQAAAPAELTALRADALRIASCDDQALALTVLARQLPREAAANIVAHRALRREARRNPKIQAELLPALAEYPPLTAQAMESADLDLLDLCEKTPLEITKGEVLHTLAKRPAQHTSGDEKFVEQIRSRGNSIKNERIRYECVLKPLLKRRIAVTAAGRSRFGKHALQNDVLQLRNNDRLIEGVSLLNLDAVANDGVKIAAAL